MWGRELSTVELSNSIRVPVEKLAKVAACRHYIEQSFAHAKGEVGLAEYESVRGWGGITT